MAELNAAAAAGVSGPLELDSGNSRELRPRPARVGRPCAHRWTKTPTCDSMSEHTATLVGRFQQTVFAVGRGQGVGLVVWLGVNGNGRGHATGSSAKGSLPAAPITERQNDA